MNETCVQCFPLQAFASYLAYKRDNNELLLFILRQLASDHLTFNRNRYGGDFELVEVPEDEFIEKVRIMCDDVQLIVWIRYTQCKAVCARIVKLNLLIFTTI